jgi:predicted amidohydrolase
MRAAAIQLEAAVGDVEANLAACERLGDEAGADGAEVIALPEFFSTGIGFVPSLVHAALPPDGAATELLRGLATRNKALVGGSFLCRDADGEVRNAYLVVRPDGTIAGRHDKDLPTMWENSFYVGGDDDGVIAVDDGLTVGAAVCWELMRTQTVRRLIGRVDLVMAGSGWWSLSPGWGPERMIERLEARNEATARRAAESFARYVGAPVIHAAHAGKLSCETPWWPIGYEGHFEGATVICAADGSVLASRDWRQGEGVVAAELEPGRRDASAEAPDRFWLHRRGAPATFAWHLHRAHGRRWYRRNVSRARLRGLREGRRGVRQPGS